MGSIYKRLVHKKREEGRKDMAIQVKEEIIKIIQESSNKSFTTSVTRELLPDNAWLVLARFGSYGEMERPRTFSITELSKILAGTMHINTMRRMLMVLEEKAFLRVVSKESGKTRTGYRYEVTTDGLIIWEKYVNEEINNVGKIRI